MRAANLLLAARTLGRGRLCVLAALLLLLVARFLPTDWLSSLDSLLGREGDTALLLAGALMLAALLGRRAASPGALRPAALTSPPAALQMLMQAHVTLEAALDQKLQEVVDDTESSALSIIAQVRTLFDSADLLVQYLENSSPQANSLGSDIVNSVSYLVEISAFIQELPAKMTRDLHSVQSVVQEITALSSLVGSVHAISMQSHLLAINAAIEGSRAGPAGAAFRIVAAEMRLLASNSSAVASQINAGLVRARAVVEGGMTTRIAESTKALSDVSQAVVSIQKLRENFEDMSQYFKTRFAVVTQHNQSLSKDIAEVLGHIQYQDVVRQCIERMRFASARRNALLQDAVDPLQQGGAGWAGLPQQMDDIAQDFLRQEEMHKHSARHDEQGSGELKFELF